MNTVPAWLLKETGGLRRSEERHSWMCEQLVHRRNAQILEESSSEANTRTLMWYKEQLAWILGDSSPSKVVEVLSDGLGFIEPNWHAVAVRSGDNRGLTNLGRGELEQMKGTIARKRRGLTGTTLKTQRAIGQDLYEPGLFLVTKGSVFFYRPGGRAANKMSGSTSAIWVDLSSEFSEFRELPVIERTEIRRDRSGEIALSLGRITREVLWECMLPPGQHYFSLILLHTSLWQETAGVWALHVAANQGLLQEPVSVELPNIRRLIEPPAYCLEDVLGWSYEFEGTHRWKRNNVDFLREALGMGRPKWTPDGIAYNSGDGPPEKEADRAAYELSVERLPSRAIRDIFRQAIKLLHAREYGAEFIGFKNLSDVGKKIVRAVEATVIGLRLGDLEASLAATQNPAGEHAAVEPGELDVGVSDLPDSIDLYLKRAEVELSIDIDLEVTDPVARGRRIVQVVRKLQSTVPTSHEQRYCLTVIQCLDNYLDKLATRRLPRHASLTEALDGSER